MPITIDTKSLTTSSHTMSPSQSPRVQPHSINLDQYELSIAQSTRKEPCGTWSCKLCNSGFDHCLRLVTHLLTSCDQPSSLSTFSTKSTIHICMFLEESGSREIFESYIRVASQDADGEGSDLDNDMDTEGTALDSDTDSEEPDSEAIISEEHDELVKEKEAGFEPEWWVEEEDEGLKSTDEDEGSAELAEHQPTPAKTRNASARSVRPPKNQDFPATPPHSLSADAKTEWTFRRNRAGDIRNTMKTHLKPNSKEIDRDAALAAWNSTSHPRSWGPHAADSKPYKSYGVLSDRESRDRARLRELTREAQGAL